MKVLLQNNIFVSPKRVFLLAVVKKCCVLAVALGGTRVLLPCCKSSQGFSSTGHQEVVRTWKTFASSDDAKLVVVCSAVGLWPANRNV
jgi:hypothetical protein